MFDPCKLSLNQNTIDQYHDAGGLLQLFGITRQGVEGFIYNAYIKMFE